MKLYETRYTKTLDYYDGIQLFQAEDPTGATYIAALLEVGESADRYLAVKCNPYNLRMFKTGVTDLRGLLEKSAEDGWYLADLSSLHAPLSMTPQPGTVIPDELLPGPGLFLHLSEQDGETTSEVHPAV